MYRSRVLNIYLCVQALIIEALVGWLVGTGDPESKAMASSLLHCSDKLPFMDVENILHMKEGLGETSYAQNSSLQVSDSPS